MATSKTGSPIVADTRALARLSKNLRRAAPDVWAACKADLRAAVEPVAADARSRASFSTKIPQSIKVRAGGSGNVKIVAGGPSAPDGAPYEHEGQPGVFRHPVFGGTQWVNQQARPFLGPAAEAHKDEVAASLEAAVARAVERALGGL